MHESNKNSYSIRLFTILKKKAIICICLSLSKGVGIFMECLKQAIDEISFLKVDEEFLLRELFKGYEWNRLAIGERRQLGSVFQNTVKNGELKGIVGMVKKSTSNQQIYVKLKG